MYKILCFIFWGYCYFYTSSLSIAQTSADTLTTTLSITQPATQPHKGRIIGISTFAGASYALTMAGLYKTWYSQYPQTNFHFFNDNSGWLQIDKVGHSWTAYAEATFASDLYQWAGVPRRRAALAGFALGNLLQGGIEVLDGFSEGWGASSGDLLANLLGASLFLAQELSWNEQRVLLKYSTMPVSYKHLPADAQARAKDLYGDNLGEYLLKDYNAQNYWLSFNIESFTKNKSGRLPKWLNIAVGYSTGGMLGAEKNIWTTPDSIKHNYTAIARYRQFFISPDIDLRRIPTRKKWLRTTLRLINVIKIPAPTLEFNTRGEIRFHPIWW